MFLVFLLLLRTVDLPYHNKRVLVASLCWGLGHATRCIPIIDLLLQQGCEVAIASDSEALHYLRAEYPSLQWFALAPYGITYTYSSMLVNMSIQAPKIWRAIRKERKQAEAICTEWRPDLIISDNRLGFRSTRVHTIYMSHQLQVQGGSKLGTMVASWMHRYYYENFDELWVPDYKGPMSLARELSQGGSAIVKTKYLGPLSRFQKLDVEKDIDILVVLSGPEPQRSHLESSLLKELGPMGAEYDIAVVRGNSTIGGNSYPSGIKIYDLLQSIELNSLLVRSRLVVCRAGYSSIMDLAFLGVPAILIPTPGQYEQLYLADQLDGRLGFVSIPQAAVRVFLSARIESLLKH